MEAVLRRHDLGPTQWYVLYHLANDGPTTQRDLTNVLRVERATLSGVVATLVRKGLVEQRQDPADQRRRVLRLTAAGESVWATLPNPIAIIASVAYAGADVAELALAARVLKDATNRLNQHPWEKYQP